MEILSRLTKIRIKKKNKDKKVGEKLNLHYRKHSILY